MEELFVSAIKVSSLRARIKTALLLLLPLEEGGKEEKSFIFSAPRTVPGTQQAFINIC